MNQPLLVNGVPLTVVGVARKGFDRIEIGKAPDIFIPVTMKSQMMPTEGSPLEARDDFGCPWPAGSNWASLASERRPRSS